MGVRDTSEVLVVQKTLSEGVFLCRNSTRAPLIYRVIGLEHRLQEGGIGRHDVAILILDPHVKVLLEIVSDDVLVGVGEQLIREAELVIALFISLAVNGASDRIQVFSEELLGSTSLLVGRKGAYFLLVLLDCVRGQCGGIHGVALRLRITGLCSTGEKLTLVTGLQPYIAGNGALEPRKLSVDITLCRILDELISGSLHVVHTISIRLLKHPDTGLSHVAVRSNCAGELTDAPALSFVECERDHARCGTKRYKAIAGSRILRRLNPDAVALGALCHEPVSLTLCIYPLRKRKCVGASTTDGTGSELSLFCLFLRNRIGGLCRVDRGNSTVAVHPLHVDRGAFRD